MSNRKKHEKSDECWYVPEVAARKQNGWVPLHLNYLHTAILARVVMWEGPVRLEDPEAHKPVSRFEKKAVNGVWWPTWAAETIDLTKGIGGSNRLRALRLVRVAPDEVGALGAARRLGGKPGLVAYLSSEHPLIDGPGNGTQ